MSERDELNAAIERLTVERDDARAAIVCLREAGWGPVDALAAENGRLRDALGTAREAALAEVEAVARSFPALAPAEVVATARAFPGPTPAALPPSAPVGEHVDFTPEQQAAEGYASLAKGGITSCRKCGLCKPRDGWRSKCKGAAKVELRAGPKEGTP